jgi:hypothetical protein
MYFEDHNPPHFHAEYGNDSAALDVVTFKILEGYLPPRIQGLVVEWALQHKNELIENWNRIQKDQKVKKIKPLV